VFTPGTECLRFVGPPLDAGEADTEGRALACWKRTYPAGFQDGNAMSQEVELGGSFQALVGAKVAGGRRTGQAEVMASAEQ
jgi:hypothetical protein